MIVYFSFLIFTSSFGFPVKTLINDSIGGPCQSNGGYNITLFNLDPFPPSPNNPPTISIYGVFTQNANVSSIITSLRSNNNIFNQNELIYKSFLQGQSQMFTYLMLVPEVRGSWTCTTQFQSSTSSDIYACWVFQYSN